MAQLQVGDKYEVVWNGSEFIITWAADSDPLTTSDTITLGVDPGTPTPPATGNRRRLLLITGVCR